MAVPRKLWLSAVGCVALLPAAHAGLPGDTATLVQLGHVELPTAGVAGAAKMGSIEDVLNYFDEFKKMQEAMNKTRSKMQAVVESRSKGRRSEAGDVNFDLYLDKEFVLGDILKITAQWGLQLQTDNCTVAVNFVPKFQLGLVVKGPVCCPLKTDWMPPLMISGDHIDLRIETKEDEIEVYGMCTPIDVGPIKINVCLVWKLLNLGGCDFNKWQVSVKALFMAYETLPVPLQGLIPTLPTEELVIGTIDASR